MKTSPSRAALEELERSKADFGAGRAQRKRELVAQLGAHRWTNADELVRFHDLLCYLRALPDDAELLEQVENLLRAFAERADLRRLRAQLENSGLAGCDIAYPFFAATARRLARRFPGALRVDWSAFERADVLEDRLHLLASYSETPGLDELAWPMKRWVQRLAGTSVSDAEFLIARAAQVGRDEAQRDAWYDELGLTLVLRGGPDTPARTHEHLPGKAPVFRTRSLRRERPDLARELRRAPLRVVELDEREGERVCELARDAMVTRQRDLDAFLNGDPRDVRRVDCGDGLEFALIGVRPERRLMFESVYACLTLSNGVPIGYVLLSALLNSAEIAYNVFDTWRGGEAGHIYGRVLAMVRALFGADSFTVYPYQLGGDGNDEGLASGAWWFYAKLGFLPRDAAPLALAEAELERVAADRSYRTPRATLRKIAQHNVYWSPRTAREDVIGRIDLSAVGVALTDELARRGGAERERAERDCARDAARRLGVRGWERWSAAERLWWVRWAPLVALLEVERWSAAERRALVEVIRAKAGRREADFVRRFDAHRRLRRAVWDISKRTSTA